MEVIDERGYLFGLVNVIDALVVLLVLAVVVAGAALVTGGGGAPAGDETTTQVIVFQTEAYPDFVIGAIEEGQIRNEDVVAVHEKRVSTVSTNGTESYDNLTRARLRVELAVQTTSDGLPTFKGDRLYVGRELTLDVRTTIVDGLVVDIES